MRCLLFPQSRGHPSQCLPHILKIALRGGHHPQKHRQSCILRPDRRKGEQGALDLKPIAARVGRYRVCGLDNRGLGKQREPLRQVRQCVLYVPVMQGMTPAPPEENPCGRTCHKGGGSGELRGGHLHGLAHVLAQHGVVRERFAGQAKVP